jgi:hypothetical protein
MLALLLEPRDSAASPRVPAMSVCKVGRVYAGGVVGREGVGDEKAEGGLDYEDLGVGTQ